MLQLPNTAYLLIVNAFEDAYCDLHIPYIVLACKSDLPRGISPSEAVQVVSKYDGGIVEISNNESGREKAKKCVGVLVRGVLRRRCE